MSDYGPAFEFLDSRGDARWTEGKYRVKAADTALLIGSLATIDFAEPGYLKAAPSNSALQAKVTGLLVQELQFEHDPWGPDPEYKDTYSYGIAHPRRLAVLTGGAGVLIKVKNVQSATRSDGRVIGAKTMYAASGLEAGESVGWDGSKFVEVGGGVTNAVATVQSISSAGLVLALLG